jgi:IclR family transcriptional regulator, pca regulon regulatory protein
VTHEPKDLVRSAAKLFAVLEAFDVHSPELTIAEVAGRAGLDRGAAFGLVHTLSVLGYLAAVPRSRRFRLTLKCLELGYTALARSDLKTHARPLLKALVPKVADAASLGILDGPDVVYVEHLKATGGRDLGFSSPTCRK